MKVIDESIEEIVLRYSERGMPILQNYLPKDLCHAAAREILSWERGRVILTTGFYVAGFAETDGPAGTLVLAKALEKLGFTPVIVTDDYCREAFDNQGIEVIYLSLDADHEEADTILEEQRPVGLISIERCGRNKNGVYANMRGVDISENTAPCDELFIKAYGKIPTIGVGDGGNEIGMGNVSDIISEKLELTPCEIKTDILVIASVSNWGAYGITAALQELSDKELFPKEGFTEAYIRKTVLLGNVDGVSHEHVFSVDGFGLDIEKEITDALRVTVHMQTEHSAAEFAANKWD